jgi:hypothetical protein
MSNASVTDEGCQRKTNYCGRVPYSVAPNCGPASAWFGEWWLARVIASEIQEIPELRRTKVESGESIVALGWMIKKMGKKIHKKREKCTR